MKPNRFTLTLILLTALLASVPGNTLHARAAATWTVNSLADPGDGICNLAECTLREAIAASVTGDTIDFSVTGTILLASQIDIVNPITISGPGASNLIVSGNGAVRVFNVNSPGALVTLSGLTIANGYISGGPVNDGAGVYNLGMLALDQVELDSNTSTGTNGGGGIYNGSHATLTITNITFSNNISPNRGGAIANYGTLTVTNSTFSANIANNGNGGGIFSFGTLTVTHSTFSGNTSTANGSGIFNGIATLTLKNSIVANGSGVDCYNGATSKPPVVAGNLIEANPSGSNACGSSAVTGDPLLSSLANHGGSTRTFSLLAGSPAIDSADDASCIATDQRGVTRPKGAHCDNGSVEVVPSTPPTVQSILRASPDPTSAASVDFTVTFTQSVTGVDAGDFIITATGLTNTSILSIIGGGTTYTVTVDSGLGNGTLRLDVADDDSIVNGFSIPLGGAGAGNGDFNGGETYTVNKLLTFTTTAAQDGWTLELSQNSNTGGSVNSTAATLRVGDDALKRQYRSVVSFNTSGLPDTAVILAANLRVRQQSVTGSGDPFVILGGLVLDIRNGYFGSAATLQAADFQAAPSGSQAPALPIPSGGWYTVPLDNSMLPFINKLTTLTGLTQLRLRFNLDDNNDSIANYISFFSGNAGTASDRPVLEVYYYIP